MISMITEILLKWSPEKMKTEKNRICRKKEFGKK